MNLINRLVYDVRDIYSIRELVESSAELYPDNPAFARRIGRDIEYISFSEAFSDIKALATYLNSLGLENSKIAVIGKNSYEWSVTYLAVCSGCGVIVPFDKELKNAEIEYLAKDSGISAIVYSDDVASKLTGLPERIIGVPMSSFAEALNRGRELMEDGDDSYSRHVVNPNGLGVLIYTSGTTGLAKGVMLSQRNICFDIMSVLRRVRVYEDDVTISLLPLHHTYQAMAGFLAFFYSGACIAFNESLRHLQDDMLLFRPTIFIAVPLLLESFLNGVKKKYSKVFGGKALYNTQMTLSGIFRKRSPGVSKAIFSSVNKAFGGRMRAILCGAAAISPEIFKEYESFGFRVYVGYGLTETSPVCIMHDDFYNSPYDTGYPILGLKVKLEDVNEDGIGELCVKGANVMLGYYNNPEQTAAVLKDGWFYTGDLARMNKNGSYTITGRLKSIIVARTGKKIFPEELEYYLEQSSFVKESLVYGLETDDDVQVAACIFPDYDEIDRELGKNKPDDGSTEYYEAVKSLITGVVHEVNRKVPHFKCIQKITIRKTEFEKTTTRKIKRKSEVNYKEE